MPTDRIIALTPVDRGIVAPRDDGIVDDGELEATARSLENPDWIDVTIHSYRHRWGNAPGDPRYDALKQRRLARLETLEVPTLMLHGAEDGATLPETSEGKERCFSTGYRREVLPGIGHFLQRERPSAVVDAILPAGHGLPPTHP